jgi:hypothetical protein
MVSASKRRAACSCEPKAEPILCGSDLVVLIVPAAVQSRFAPLDATARAAPEKSERCQRVHGVCSPRMATRRVGIPVGSRAPVRILHLFSAGGRLVPGT